MLELPRTIRELSEDDFPSNPHLIERLHAKRNAKIVEGFKILENKEKLQFPYSFYAEINVNNSKLWDLFISLSGELPKVAALLFSSYNDEVNYGKYVSKDEIIRALKKYEREITEDCHLEIGLIYNTESELTEIFIAESKYIQFWGTNERSFRKIMLDFNLKEISDIEFIDEYPKVVYPLKRIVNDVAESYEIVADLKEKFIR